MKCEEVQLGIERHHRGAAEEGEVRLLEEHLEGCLVCRDYGRVSSNLASAVALTGQVDREALLRAVTRRRAYDRWGVTGAAVLGFLGSAIWLTQSRGILFAVNLALVVAHVGVVTLFLRWSMNRWSSMERLSAEELLPALRRETERRIATLSEGRWTLPLCTLGTTGSLCALRGLLEVPIPMSLLVWAGAVTVVASSLAIYLHLVELPRLRRERREIE